MLIDFPSTGLVPNVTTYTSGSKTWIWTGAAWKAVLISPSQGIQGNQGTQGLQGPQGLQGTLGIQGTGGTQGTQGVQGAQGLQGTVGIQGPLTGIATYIQPTQPSVDAGVQYLWWQKTGSNLTLWINDGL
jgi:hypothetical protein